MKIIIYRFIKLLLIKIYRIPMDYRRLRIRMYQFVPKKYRQYCISYRGDSTILCLIPRFFNGFIEFIWKDIR